jgi:hypothetical protein
MPLPNINPAINPAIANHLTTDEMLRQQKMTKQNTELIAKFNDNLTNITSLGQNFQMGVYNAFGNNFLTRGALSIPAMFTDFLDTMLEDQTHDKKNDPLKESLDEMLKELHKIDDHLATTFGDSIKNAFKEAVSDISSNKQDANTKNDCCEENKELLQGIIDRLDSVFGNDGNDVKESSDNSVNPNDILNAINTINRRNSEKLDRDELNVKKPILAIENGISTSESIKNKNSKLNPDLIQDVETNIIDKPNPIRIETDYKKGPLASKLNPDLIQDVEVKKQKKSNPSIKNVFDIPNFKEKKKRKLPLKDVVDVSDTGRSSSIIKNILDLLTKTKVTSTTKKETIDVNIIGNAFEKLVGIENSMLTLVNSIPMSTQETSLEADRNNKPVRELSRPELGDKKETKKEESTKTETPTKEKEATTKESPSLLSSAIDAAENIAEIGSLTKKVGSLFPKLARVAKGFGVGSIASIGLDFAADAVGKETKTGAGLDIASDITGGASTGALIGSLIPIPGIGTGIGAAAGGLIGGAHGLYKNWDKFFDSKPENMEAVDRSKASTFEESTDDLDRINKETEKKSTANIDSGNKIISNNVRNNNIFPTRQSTKNDDFSFNRYLDKSFS